MNTAPLQNPRPLAASALADTTTIQLADKFRKAGLPLPNPEAARFPADCVADIEAFLHALSRFDLGAAGISPIVDLGYHAAAFRGAIELMKRGLLPPPSDPNARQIRTWLHSFLVHGQDPGSWAHQQHISMKDRLHAFSAVENIKDPNHVLLAACEGNFETVQTLLEVNDDVANYRETLSLALGQAALMGRAADFKSLIRLGAEIRPHDANGENLLNIAARGGAVEIIDHLLHAGMPVSGISANGKTPLHEASARGHLPAINRLLEAGAELQAATPKGETALHEAARYGRCAALGLLIEKGLDPNVRRHDLATPLHLASAYGQGDAVQTLIDQGAQPLVLTSDLASPLHCACQAGSLSAVQVLLKKRPEVNARDIYGETPVFRAAIAGHADLIKPLRAAGADIDAPEFDSFSHFRAAYERGDRVQILRAVNLAAKPKYRNREGRRPIHVAAALGADAVVRALVSHGANPDLPCGKGATALHYAILGQKESALHILIEAGANVNQIWQDRRNSFLYQLYLRGDLPRILEARAGGLPTDVEGPWITALHLAVTSGTPQIVHVLLLKGALPDARDYLARTALHEAAWAGHPQIAQILLQQGANARAQDLNGNTPLHDAALRGDADVCRLLIEAGARPDMPNRFGVCASTLAPLEIREWMTQAALNPRMPAQPSHRAPYFLRDLPGGRRAA